MALNPLDDTLAQLPAAPPPPPAPSSMDAPSAFVGPVDHNDYDDLFASQHAAQETRVRRSVVQGSALTPDTAAEARRLSLTFGDPPAVIARNLDAYRTRASTEEATRQLQGSAGLADWIAQDPTHAAVTHDDLPALSALSRALTIGRNLAGAAAAGVMDFSQGIWGAIEATAELPTAPGGLNRMVGQLPAAPTPKEVTTLAPDQEAAFQAWVAANKITDVDAADSHYDYRGYFNEFGAKPITFGIDHFTDTYKQHGHPTFSVESKYSRGAGDGGTWSGETFMPARPPLDDRSLARFAHGAAMVAQQLAERARGPQTGAGFAERAAYSGIESIGQMAPGLVAAAATGGSGLLLSLAGVTTGGQSYSQAREHGVAPGTALAFGTIQGAIEVGTEFLPAHYLLRDLKAGAPLVQLLAHQVASELPGEEVATALQDLNEWAFLPANKDRTFRDYLNERPSAAAATAISVLVSVGATAVVTHGTVRMIEQLGKAAEASKTVQRDPAAAHAALDHVDAHGGETPTVFYAPIDPFTAYWQEQGIDPAVMAATLTGSPTAYADAVASGTKLAMPAARYAATLAATPHNEFFKDEITLDPAAMNGREYAALLAEPAPDAPAVEAVSVVRTAVVDQLTQAGYPAETAAHYADLFTSATGEGVFGAGLAARAGETGRGGLDLAAFYAKYGLTVGRPDVAATTPIPETQAAPAGLLGTDVAPASETPAGVPVAAGTPSAAYRDYAAQFDTETADVGTAVFLGYGPDGPLYNVQGGPSDRSTLGVAGLVKLGIAVPETPADTGERLTGAQLRANVLDARAARARVDRAADAADNPGNYFNAETRNAPAAQEGLRSGDAPGQQSAADVVGDEQRRGDGDVAESRGPAPRGLPGIDEVFVREDQAVTEARLTPEVERNLRWVLEELDNFRYTPATWHWLTDETGTRGNVAGGHADKRAAVGGAPVYADVLGYSPVNTISGGTKKGQPAREASGSRAKVEDAIRTLLDTRHVTTNLMEGALRVAEARNAGDWKNLERPMIPPPWGTPVARAFTDQLSDAIDQAGDAVDTGEGDASFNIDEFGQSLFDALSPLDTATASTSEPQIFNSYTSAAAAASPGERVRGITVSGGPPQFVIETHVGNRWIVKLADTLDTGEVQPRLPGDTGAVREQNVQTPAFEAPFSLTSEAAQTTAKQSTLFQGTTPPRRGVIRFGPDRQFNIALLERADLSTFIHEAGHFFLEVFGDIADTLHTVDSAQLTADQQAVLNDYGATLRTLGVAHRREIGTAQHETWARLFEAHLMEGKAPSVELQPAFSRFRAWLIGIYKSLSTLNVRLTPEVRGVFDRLLASNQAIAEAQTAQGVPLFTTAESAGMTPEKFALYRQTITEAATAARETLDRRLMAEVQREQTAVWKAQRAAIRTTVEAETYQQPVYRALAAILKGELPNGEPMVEGMITPPLSLSRAEVTEAYGADRVKRLPRGVTVEDGGMSPTTVAELFGYSSGDELLAALEHAPAATTVIERETSRRMLAEHGSLLLDGTLHGAAEAAVASDQQEAVLRAELAALHALQRTVTPFERQARAEARAAAGEKVVALTGELSRLKRQTRSGAATIRAGIPTADQVRTAAETRIAATPVRRLQPYTFWVAARQASRAAVEHAARQDFTAAIGAKTDELLNLAYYREATRAKDDATARATFARSLATPAVRKTLGLAGQGYLDQVDGVLDRFEFAKVSGAVLDRRAALAKFVTALESEGLPVEFPDILLDEARRTNYQDLTVDELVGVTDGLKQLVHLARLKNQLLSSADARAFAEVRDDVADSIRVHNPAHALPLEFRPGDEKYRKVKAWFASHAKIAILARGLDGHQDGGAMWEAFIRPINAAADAEVVRNAEAGKTYAAILQAHYPGRELAALNDKLFIPAINASLSKEARLAVLLNWGNQTSRDRLLNDPTRRWDEGQIRAIIDTLDARDGRFVQATWDYVNSFWAEIAAKQQRVTGVAPEKVEALPVATQFGLLAGGYYPLAYDGRLAPRADQLAAVSDAKLAVSAAYVSATTRRGHTKARVEGVRLPVRLELGVLFNHLAAVIHDLTHHEMLIDTTRLLRDAQVQAALVDTKGDLVYQQFTSALQDIALGASAGRGKPTALDSAANFMKTGTQIAGLGWNLWTALQQPLGVFNGMSRVGPVWVARGMKRWLRDAASMENTHAWIQDVSPMMRERAGTLSQDMHDLRGALRQPGGWFDSLVRTVSADHLTQQTITDGFLWHIGLAQRVADIPTWLGGYEKAMAAPTEGRTLEAHEARAVALADQGVLDSQGGGQIKDLAQVQRGSPVAKLFMTFYSYGNMLGNATAERVEATSFKDPASVVTLLGHLSLLYVLPALGTAALSRAMGKAGGDGDTPEKFLTDVGQEILSGALNTMVFVRELGGLVKGGARGYEGPAGTRLLQLTTALVQQVEQGKLDVGLEKAALSVSGVLFRYPAAQVQRTIDGWVALHEGRTHNPGALLVGAPKKAHR